MSLSGSRSATFIVSTPNMRDLGERWYNSFSFFIFFLIFIFRAEEVGKFTIIENVRSGGSGRIFFFPGYIVEITEFCVSIYSSYRVLLFKMLFLCTAVCMYVNSSHF